MIKEYSGTLYGVNRQLKFSDVWDNSESFITEYNDIGIPATIDNANCSTLYYLLYSKYGNSTIASSDINRFKYDLFGIIWQYGANWVKRLEIQDKLRNLTDEQMREGGKSIYNVAQNPSTDPSNFTDNELQFINSQNVSKNKKGVLDGYAILTSLLDDDVTSKFLSRFKRLFKTFNLPEMTLLYETEVEDEQ